LCMANSPMSFWYALICSLGSTLGGMLGYGIGRIGGRPLLERGSGGIYSHSLQGIYH
jgi:membrane protein YqaA with SNARE-associated domain